MYKETIMTGHIIEPHLFPHITLSERSARPGVDGPRYVPINENRLGDTNEGKVVYPSDPWTDQLAPGAASIEPQYREGPSIR